MNIRRIADYRARAASDCWREASAQLPVLLMTGPRQVGKTTLLRNVSDDNRTYVTLDDLAGRGTPVSHDAVVCVGAERLPLNRDVDVIPVGWL